MVEIIFVFLLCLILLDALWALGMIAIGLNARFLLPFIFASVWWLCAGANFHDARVLVERTGYVRSKGERAASFMRGAGQLLITIPFFKTRHYAHHFVAWNILFFVFSVLILPCIIQKIVDTINH